MAYDEANDGQRLCWQNLLEFIEIMWFTKVSHIEAIKIACITFTIKSNLEDSNEARTQKDKSNIGDM